MIIQEKIHGLRLADDNEIQVNIFLKFEFFFEISTNQQFEYIYRIKYMIQSFP